MRCSCPFNFLPSTLLLLLEAAYPIEVQIHFQHCTVQCIKISIKCAPLAHISALYFKVHFMFVSVKCVALQQKATLGMPETAKIKYDTLGGNLPPSLSKQNKAQPPKETQPLLIFQNILLFILSCNNSWYYISWAQKHN